MPEIKLINNYLSNFGKCDNSNNPLFRLVWSDDQTEIRKGEFREFSGPIFIREVKGVREVPKYNYIHERWILERFIPGVYAANPELPLSQYGSYEPIWVFEDNKGNYLNPTIKVIEVIMGMIHQNERLTERERINNLLKEEDNEVKHFMDMIDTSEIGNALRMKEAVGYSGIEMADNKG